MLGKQRLKEIQQVYEQKFQTKKERGLNFGTALFFKQMGIEAVFSRGFIFLGKEPPFVL